MNAEWIDNNEEIIPNDFKEVWGFDSPKELAAYEKGREHESATTLKWISDWDGGTNSGMGQILIDKYNQLFHDKFTK